MSARYLPNPMMICDTENDRASSWPNGVWAYCLDTKRCYYKTGGAWVQHWLPAHVHAASDITSGLRIIAAGVATLSGGSVTVMCPQISANSVVIMTPRGPISGTLGLLRMTSINAGVSFSVASLTGILDNTSFGYIVVEPS